MKKLIVLLVGLVAILFGCSSGGSEESSGSSASKGEDGEVVWEENLLDPEDPVTVRFYSYSLGNAAMKDGTQQLIDTFNETVGKEKGVQVEGVVDDYTIFKKDIQAGLQVDIVQDLFRTLDDSKTNYGFKAFEDVFPEEEIMKNKEGIHEAALQLGVIDGKTYGWPFTFSTPILYINSTIFEEAGLDPNDPPKTWDEMYEISKVIKEETGKDALSLTQENGWISQSIFYSNGADVLTDDRTEAIFASPEGIEAIESWKRFFDEGLSTPGTDAEVTQQFMAGNSAMMIQSTSVYTGVKKSAEDNGFELAGGVMPSFEGKEYYPTNSGSALTVRPDTEQKAQAVWEFVKFATSPEAYTMITEEMGYLPLRTEIADDPAYLKEYIDENPLLRLNIETLPSIKGTEIWPGDYSAELESTYKDTLSEALITDRPVEEVLKEGQERMNQIIGQ